MTITAAVERSTIRDAARRAALLCLDVLHGTADRPRSMEKAAREPVTIADYGAQAIVLHTIAEQFPGDGAIAEERAAEFEELVAAEHGSTPAGDGQAGEDSQRRGVIRHLGKALGREVTLDEVRRWLDWGRDRSSRRVWTVDPVDGTKGFLRGDQFAVAVALIVDGQLELAALACPRLPLDTTEPQGAMGVLAVAQRGQGATVEPLAGGPARRLRVSSRTDAALARLLESVESQHTDHSASAQLRAVAGIEAPPVRMDSQAKYVALADGRAELYLRQSPGAGYAEKIWDHAAGVLIVEEAGGRVSDLTGCPLDFSCGPRLTGNRGVLATNGALHDHVLNAIRLGG